MAFGDEIDSLQRNDLPSSIGGSSNTIYMTNRNVEGFELSPSDFSQIRQSSVPGQDARGIGGTTSVIWYNAKTGSYTSALYELATSDFSTVRSTDDQEYSVGGGDNVIWASRYSKIQELSTADFSVVQEASEPIDVIGGGNLLGGDSNAVWYGETGGTYIAELSTADLSALREGDAPTEGSGIGGSADRIWHSDINDFDGSGGFVREIAEPIPLPDAPTNLSVTIV